MGRGDVANRDHSVPFPPQRGLLQTEMTSGCSKRGKLGQLSVLQGWGHQKGCEMGSLVCSDVCGKMEWDTKLSRAGAALVPVGLK